MLRSIRTPDLLERLESWGHLIQLLLAERRGPAWFQVVVRYILRAARHPPAPYQIRNAMERVVGPEAGAIVMSTSDKLATMSREQGFKLGHQVGREKGLEQGVREGREKGFAMIESQRSRRSSKPDLGASQKLP